MTRASLAAALVLAGSLAGCASTRPRQPGPAYPASLRQDRVLDVQVIRRGTRIELTNTSPKAFGPSILWLNRRFARRLDSWGVGQKLDLSLREFVDEFGVPFRAGGFFATEPPQTLVMAQIQPEAGEVIGLVVVAGTGEE